MENPFSAFESEVIALQDGTVDKKQKNSPCQWVKGAKYFQLENYVDPLTYIS